MISWKYKLWRTAGVAAALGMAACGGEGGEAGKTGESGATTAGEAGETAPAQGAGEAGEAAIGESGGESGEAGAANAYAGLSGDQRTALRLQHLKGFVLIAQRTVQAGAAPEAAALVQQGLLEAYAPAQDQFGAYDVATARAAGESAALGAAQLGQRLNAAASAIDGARGSLHVNYADLSARMLDISNGLYQGALTNEIVDPTEYQHSLGAALAARDALAAGRSQLRARNAAAYDLAMAELDRLVALWPQGAAPEQPPSYRHVLAQSSRVRLALSPFL